jgi:hypothetical protein
MNAKLVAELIDRQVVVFHCPAAKQEPMDAILSSGAGIL